MQYATILSAHLDQTTKKAAVFQTSGIDKGPVLGFCEISTGGVTTRVRSAEIGDKTVIVTGGWLKVASVKDEDWLEGDGLLAPESLIAQLRQLTDLGADIFSFSQRPTDPTPRFPFLYEWDSVAAVPTVSFRDWWDNRVSTDLRRDVRKAAKCGVTVRVVEFNDDFVRRITEIYDESPVRQDRPYWHYKRGFEFAKRANATYRERSEFLGAFVGDELIGFLKIVYVDRLARLMQIISKDAHRDKRPMNALIAKAVEVCEAKGCSYLTYGKYRYSQGPDGITAFKHRNGFREIVVPKYYVPLTTKGKLASHLRLHRGGKALLPAFVLRSLRRLRASVYRHSPVTHWLT